MNQGNSKAPEARITVGSIRISGAPTATRASDLGQALRRGLEGALASAAWPQDGTQSLDVPNLRLRLPAGASEAEITDAVARAIIRGSGGKSS